MAGIWIAGLVAGVLLAAAGGTLTIVGAVLIAALLLWGLRAWA